MSLFLSIPHYPFSLAKFYSIRVGNKLKILVFDYLIQISFKEDSLIAGYITVFLFRCINKMLIVSVGQVLVSEYYFPYILTILPHSKHLLLFPYMTK